MDNNTIYTLKIEEPTFEQFRLQFNAQLKAIFTKLIDMNLEKAAISVKFNIDMLEHDVEDPDTGDYATIKSPIISHKIATTIQMKAESDGKFGSVDYQLIWNKQKEAYELFPVKKSQRSLFDDSFEYDDPLADESDADETEEDS